MIEIILPIHTQSEANIREHWAVKAKRNKAHRRTAWAYTRDATLGRTLPDKMTIRLTRIAPRRLDTDNLARSFKAAADGIADALGIDDGDPRLTWLYAQQKGKPKQYEVKVEIKEAFE